MSSQTKLLSRQLLAEGLGTFVLVTAGTGAIIVNELSGGVVSHFGIALTFGLTVLTVIYAIGEVSGAHINPAVTIGFWLAGRFPGKKIAPYICVQLLGAVVGSAFLALLFPEHQTLGATLPSGRVLQSFLLEVFLSWYLMYVILAVATGAKEQGIMAGVSIGAVVGLEALFAGPISGASMNPARSLGPALIAGIGDSQWIYLFAPVLGAALAVASFRLTHNKLRQSAESPQDRQCEQGTNWDGETYRMAAITKS